MPNFAANLSFLYPDLPFLDRFAAAARDGFDAVEFLFPYAFDARDVKARLDDHGLKQVLFNVSPGDWDGGERGLAARPGHEARFRAAVHEALAYAQVLGCPRLHVMAGLTEPDTARQLATYREILAWAFAWASCTAAWNRASWPGRAARPRSPPSQSPGETLNSTCFNPWSARRAFTSRASNAYGNRNSTASKPSRAAAAKRSRNGRSG